MTSKEHKEMKAIEMLDSLILWHETTSVGLKETKEREVWDEAKSVYAEITGKAWCP